jgi:TusA-related sulfurtransferase
VTPSGGADDAARTDRSEGDVDGDGDGDGDGQGARIDARGRRCPLPILDLAREIRRVPVGATVTVEADDPAADPDVRAWCRMRGHDLVEVTQAEDGTPAYTVRRRH